MIDRRMAGAGLLRRAARAVTGGASDPRILRFEDGTFTRASSGTYLTSANTIAHAAANELRWENRGDGNGAVALFEGARTNLLTRSEEFNLWGDAFGFGSVVTANTHAAPDGTLTADTVTDPSLTGNRFRWSNGVSVTSGQRYRVSIFVRKDSNTARFPATAFINSGASIGAILQINTMTGETTTRGVSSATVNGHGTIDFGDAWLVWLDITFSASTTALMWANGADSSAWGSYTPIDGSAVFWGAQAELASFPSSYVPTAGGTVARAADVLTFADVPTEMRSGSFALDVYPYWGTSEIADGTSLWILSFGKADDGIRFRRSGSSRLVETLRGGSVIAARTFTASRNQRLTVTVGNGGGSLTLAGATTGDGSDSGAGGTWPAANMRIGGVYGASSEAFARISEPRAA